MEVIRHPGWKNAIDEILKRVESEGYGVFFSHEEIKGWLKIEPPTTIQEAKRKEFEYLNALDHIRTELLEDNCMYLDNKMGEGYTILMPVDQVDKAVEKHMRKMQACLRKGQKTLMHVNSEMIDAETEIRRQYKLQKIAFIRQATRKRTLPEPKERKKLKEG